MDRCDPQLAQEALERCKRILELRAQEFNAPAPPQLSAEQQLLAEQRADDEQLGRSSDTRLRLPRATSPMPTWRATRNSRRSISRGKRRRRRPADKPAPQGIRTVAGAGARRPSSAPLPRQAASDAPVQELVSGFSRWRRRRDSNPRYR